MNKKPELTIKENMKLVQEGKEPAWLPSFHEDCAQVSSRALGRKRDRETGHVVDVFGTRFIDAADGMVPDHACRRLKDIAKWKEIMPDIDLRQIDWEEEARIIRAKTVREGQVVHLQAGYVWVQIHYMMGFEEALVALVQEPEAIYECMDAIADFHIAAMRALCPYLKPDYAVFFEHMATARGMLISPDTYRRLIKPIQKKMYGAVTELGVIPEIHIDGLIEDILPDLAELGIRAIQPFQVMNDINRYKEQYGLLAIGGWDAFGRGNQEDSTEEDIRASARLAMDTYGPGGRYVFWGSGITGRYPGHMDILTDEANIYGRNYYRK